MMLDNGGFSIPYTRMEEMSSVRRRRFLCESGVNRNLQGNSHLILR